MNDDLREAARRGIRNGFDTFRREQIMRPAREGTLSAWALDKEKGYVKKLKLRSHLAFVIAFVSWGLALYLFYVGNVWGGFGAGLSVCFWAFWASVAATIANNIDQKHYLASALDWAEKDSKKREST